MAPSTERREAEGRSRLAALDDSLCAYLNETPRGSGPRERSHRRAGRRLALTRMTPWAEAVSDASPITRCGEEDPGCRDDQAAYDEHGNNGDDEPAEASSQAQHPHAPILSLALVRKGTGRHAVARRVRMLWATSFRIPRHCGSGPVPYRQVGPR